MTRIAEICAKHTDAIAQKNSDLAARQARKRAAFPVVASLVDDIVAEFGPVAAVPYGCEPDGRSFGRQGERGVCPVLERIELKDSEPARVNKTRPATKDRWYAEDLDC